jgi:hypothetical protein
VSQDTLIGLVVGSVVTIVVSIVVTWLFAHVYYLRGGQDLKREAEQLRIESGRVRQMVNVLAHALAEAKVIYVTWGPDGELTDWRMLLSGTATSAGGGIATLTVTPNCGEQRTHQ